MNPYVFRDDFQQGLSLQRLLPFGHPNWKLISGVWRIRTDSGAPCLVGRAHAARREEDAILVTAREGWRNCALSVQVQAVTPSSRPPEGGVILYLRYGGVQSHHAVHLCLPKQSLELWRCDRGSWHQVGDICAVDIRVSQWYTVSVLDAGDRLACFVDGHLLLDSVDHSPPGGRIGLGAKFCEAAFARVEVLPLVAPFE